MGSAYGAVFTALESVLVKVTRKKKLKGKTRKESRN